MISHPICRVCGRAFPSPRRDAITCSGTCRSRLKRGAELTYLAELSPARQQKLKRPKIRECLGAQTFG
jgi:hypothetical protein